MELVGHELGRYRLVELIGRGGMGAVYRAHDTALHREVAVKVLAPTEAGGEKRLERFRREARAVARLSHPNILAIHDFGEHDGATFAVTELLEGEDLATRLQGSPLLLHEAIWVAVEVAEGLAAAHREGILHRDIKPHNIFLTADRNVKILDFGLARSTEHGDRAARTETAAPDLTEEGAVLGTIAYMSPEQVRGETVDHRSDLFSLGTVLYQMLTGDHPFRRESRVDTMSSILRDEPPPPSAQRSEIPPTLDEIVLRCLRKAPGLRFQSADDLAFALRTASETRTASGGFAAGQSAVGRRRAWFAAAAVALVALAGAAAIGLRDRSAAAVPVLPETKRIVIARFQPATDDPELRALAAGMTEVVASGLATVAEADDNVAWLRPQAPEDRPQPDELDAVFRELNPNLAITGTVDRLGDRIILSMHAVDPTTGSVVRDIELANGFGNPATLQLEPVKGLAQVLALAVSDETTDTLQSRATNSTDSLDAYVRGIGVLALANATAEIESAIGILDDAVAADPLFTPARVAIAHACLRLHSLTGDPSWLDRGTRSVQAAMGSQASAGQVELAMAALRDDAGDLDAAIAASERAVAADPANPEAHAQLARRLHRAGRTVDAEDQLQRAMFLRPGYWPDHHWMARFHIAEGRYDAAVNEFRRVVELAPGYVDGYSNLGAMYAYLGQPDRAREVFERSLEIEPHDNYPALANLGTLAFEEGRYADAAELFERALEVEDADYQVWGNLGHCHTLMGNRDAADASLHRAIDLALIDLRARPDDVEVWCHLAGYHADLGEREAGLEALDQAIERRPEDPMLIAFIAQVLEDLGDRDRALEWVGKSLSGGVDPSYFDSQSSLRDLVTDPRYQELVDRADGATG